MKEKLRIINFVAYNSVIYHFSKFKHLKEIGKKEITEFDYRQDVELCNIYNNTIKFTNKNKFEVYDNVYITTNNKITRLFITDKIDDDYFIFQTVPGSDSIENFENLKCLYMPLYIDTSDKVIKTYLKYINLESSEQELFDKDCSEYINKLNELC